MMKVFLFLTSLILIISCSKENDLFENTISKPTVFLLFDQEEYEFAVTKLNTSSEVTITIDPDGGVPASEMVAELEAPFRLKGGAYPGTGGTCETTVTTICTVVIEFAPEEYGNYESEIKFTYWTGKKYDSISKMIKGDTNAGLAFTELTHTFATLVLKLFSTKTFTIQHLGGVPAEELNFTSLVHPFSIISHNCPTILPTNQTCTVTTRFNPTVVGDYTSDVVINYFDYFDHENTNTNVSGTGIPPARLSLSLSETYDFGLKANTSTTTVNFELSYVSGAVIGEEIQFLSTPSAPFSLTGSVCYQGTLNTGQTCSFSLTFAPTIAGHHSHLLRLRYFDGAEEQIIQKQILAHSEKQAILSIQNSSPQAFGVVNVGQTSDLVFTLQNDPTSYFSATSVTTSAGLTAPFNYKGGSFPGTGGNCGQTIAPGPCSIVITFSPTTIGNFSRTFNFTYHNGASAQVTNSLTVTGGSQAKINASVATLAFSNTTINATRDLTLTLTNAGLGAANSLAGNVINAPFSYKGGSFPGIGGSCQTTLNGLSSCTVVFTFAPTVPQLDTTQFNLSYNDGFNAQNTIVNISGTGLTPAELELGSTINFGLQNNNTTTEHTLTVIKSGQTNATSVAFSLTGTGFTYKGGVFPGTGGTCAATITTNCTIILNYLPTSTNTYNGVLSVSYFTGAVTTSDSVNLTGTSITAAILTFTPSTYNFGTRTINSVTETTITITNSGEVNGASLSLTLSAPFSFKGTNYPGTGGTCSGTLNFGQSCTIVINFTPTLAQLSSQSFNLSYDNGFNSTSVGITLSGTGRTPAQLELGSNIDFGIRTNGTSTQHTLTVTKTGQTDATAVLFSLTGTGFVYKGGSFPGTGGTCSTTITTTCTVILLFEPSSAISYSETLSVSYFTGATTTSDSVSLLGSSITPAQLELGSDFDYGQTTNGSSTQHTLTVTKTGQTNATSVSFSLTGTGFIYKGGTFPGTGGNCSATISNDCSIVILFNPTTTQTYNGQISVSYQTGNGGATDSTTLSGSSLSPALLSITPSTYDYGTQVLGSSTDFTYTIENTGESTATSLDVNLNTIFKYKDDAFPGTGGSCTASLAPATSCEIVISYEPQSVNGDELNTQLSYHNGLTSTNTTLSLFGLGEVIPDPDPMALMQLNLYKKELTSNEFQINSDPQKLLTKTEMDELAQNLNLEQKSQIQKLKKIGDINFDEQDDFFIGIYKKMKKNYQLSSVICIDGLSLKPVFKINNKKSH